MSVKFYVVTVKRVLEETMYARGAGPLLSHHAIKNTSPARRSAKVIG